MKKSLLKSILLSSMGVLAAALIIVCLIFSVNVNIQYTRSIKSDLYHTVATESAKMDTWFTQHTTIAEGFAQTALQQDLHGSALQQYIVDVILPCSPNIMDGYLAWEADESGMVCGIYPVEDTYVAKERDWYIEARSTKKTVITAPYVDVATGNLVITIAAPLKSNNGIIGVCGLDIEVTELVNITQELNIGDGGYSVLVDGDNNIVIHAQNPDYSHRLDGQDETVTKLVDIAPIYTDVLAAAGSTNVVSGKGYDGTMRYFPVVPIGDTGWKVLYAADYHETMKPLVNVVVLAVIVSASAIACGTVFFILKFTKRIRPLTNIANIVTSMSNGVLDHTYPNAANDEIGTICDNLEMTNRSLKSYINEIGRILEHMSDGDFVYDSNVTFAGEFAEVELSIRNICSAMHDIFGQLGDISREIANGSSSVSSGASELADAAADETRLIGDVSASLDTISRRVTKSADSAFYVKERAVKATDTVTAGNTQMQDLVHIMDRISHSASEIVSINKTIEDIAFQTNILALNASIEASRAGAAGKGFAVVAEEVRSLANKSSEASSSTAALIGETVKTIKDGTAAANSTAIMLEEVVKETRSISSSVSEIADASEEEKIMLSEITEKLAMVEKVIGTTSDTAYNAAQASGRLDDQVIKLKNNLEYYK